MRVMRLLTVFVSIFLIGSLQSCGSGGGSSDTAGALTISSPASTDNGNGTSIVTFTVTYAPPAGKTAQGVVVSVNVDGATTNHTFTSGSNSASFSILSTNGTLISISASVNSMTSSTIFFVPAGGTGGGGALLLTPTTMSFLFTDTAGFSQSISISGGTPPYTVVSTVPTDISVIMATGTTATVTLVNAASPPAPGILSTATVTVTDSSTPAATGNITVNYFK
ncbi:MAG: hypothetical protein M0023_16610 [Desulfobacteraceae bacterium]|nr:hypothetical protein [Desulfobacteraceae bacterium]